MGQLHVSGESCGGVEQRSRIMRLPLGEALGGLCGAGARSPPEGEEEFQQLHDKELEKSGA